MKVILLVFSFLNFNSFSQLDSLSFYSKLKDVGFPIKILSNYYSTSISFKTFEERAILEYYSCDFPTKFTDSLIYDFHFVRSKISFGKLEFYPNFYVVTNKSDSLIVEVFANSKTYGFFRKIDEFDYWLEKCNSKEVVASLFNSTEFKILETYNEGFGGYCYDSLVDSKLIYYFNISIRSNNEIIENNQKMIVGIFKDSMYCESLNPLFKIKSGDVFLYTYGVNKGKGKPEIIRYREVYYDINSKKIIKDQLSSEFIYYDVDKW